MPPCRQTSVAPRDQASFGSARDFFPIEDIGRAAKIVTGLAFRERAELTLVKAEIRVIDIAVDDVGDSVARRLCGGVSAASQTASKSEPRAENNVTICVFPRVRRPLAARSSIASSFRSCGRRALN